MDVLNEAHTDFFGLDSASLGGINLEKVQGATRPGATGLRASEREICLSEGL